MLSSNLAMSQRYCITWKNSYFPSSDNRVFIKSFHKLFLKPKQAAVATKPCSTAGQHRGRTGLSHTMLSTHLPQRWDESGEAGSMTLSMTRFTIYSLDKRVRWSLFGALEYSSRDLSENVGCVCDEHREYRTKSPKMTRRMNAQSGLRCCGSERSMVKFTIHSLDKRVRWSSIGVKSWVKNYGCNW